MSGNGSSSGAAEPAVASSLSNTAPRALTWAQRAAGKSSSSSTSNPAASTSSTSSSGPTQSTSSTTANAEKSEITADSSTSTEQPISSKSRIPTSADSGWGEGETSHENQAADASTSNLSIPVSEPNKPAASSNGEVQENAVEAKAEPAPVKVSSGPPKVNIWAVRKEAAAKQLAEQAKLREEREALEAAQRPKGLPTTDEASTTAGPTKKTKSQKKRENAAAAAAASPSGTAQQAPSSSQAQTNSNASNKGKLTAKPTQNTSTKPPSSSPTSAQIPTSTSTKSSNQDTPAASTIPDAIAEPSNPESWPSPLEKKEAEDKETERRSAAEKDERERAREDSSNRSVSSVATSPSNEKKKPIWKSIQPEITFNAPLPARQGVPTSRSNSKGPQTGRNNTSKASSVSSAASPSVEKKQSEAATGSSDMCRQGSNTSASQSGKKNKATEAKATNNTAGESKQDGGVASQNTTSTNSPSTNASPSQSARPLHASLPAKPITSPSTQSTSTFSSPSQRPRQAPSMPNHPSSSSVASLSSVGRSFASPGATPSLSDASLATETVQSSEASNAHRGSSEQSGSQQQLGYQGNPSQYNNGSRGRRSTAGPPPRVNRDGSQYNTRGPNNNSNTRNNNYNGGDRNTRNTSANNYMKGQPLQQQNFNPYNGSNPGFYYDQNMGNGMSYYAPQGYGQPYPVYQGQPSHYFDPSQSPPQQHPMSNAGSPPPQPQMLPYPGPVQQYGMQQYSNAFVAPPPLPYPPVYERPAPLFDYSLYPFPPDGTAYFVLGQIEFYFSTDNLVKDTWMRQKMDAEGWVEIPIIASFKRLATLTTDINLIREMMKLSYMCEIRENKVRSRDWQTWVLPGAKAPSWQEVPQNNAGESQTGNGQMQSQETQPVQANGAEVAPATPQVLPQ